MPFKKALQIGENSTKKGFDWADALGALSKVEEETQELKEVIESKNIKEQKKELGDCLFALAQVARHLKIDPLECLNECNLRFEKRFNLMCELMKKDNKKIENLDLDEMHIYWEKAKNLTME